VKGTLTLEDTLTFGRHKGKTVQQVIIDDAGWLCWLRSEEAKTGRNQFDSDTNELLDKVIQEVKDLHRKFGSTIGKWKELGDSPRVRIEFPDTVAPPPVETAVQYDEGWGAW